MGPNKDVQKNTSRNAASSTPTMISHPSNSLRTDSMKPERLLGRRYLAPAHRINTITQKVVKRRYMAESLSRHWPGVFRDVPQHTGRIADVEDTNAPGLHLRRLRHTQSVLFLEPIGDNVVPPRVDVLDAQRHHEVLRMLLDVELLQDDSAVIQLHSAGTVVAPYLLEAQVLVEAFRGLEVPGGDKCPNGVGLAAWHAIQSWRCGFGDRTPVLRPRTTA